MGNRRVGIAAAKDFKNAKLEAEVVEDEQMDYASSSELSWVAQSGLLLSTMLTTHPNSWTRH